MIMIRPWSLVALLLALTVTSRANASYVIYNDGAVHTQSTATTNYYGIMASSTFQVTAGGSITSTTTGNIGIFLTSGTVSVSGGSVTGGTDGILAENSTSTLTISGGQVTGGAGVPGASAIVLNNVGPTTISGGTITGGQSTLNEVQGGAGITYNGGSPLLITGGIISGGASTGAYPFTGYSLVDDGGGNVEVSGGQFLSRIRLSFTSEPSELDFFGTGLAFNTSTDYLTGTLSDGSTINQNLQIYDNFPYDFSIVVNPMNTEVSFVFKPGAVPEPSSIVLIAIGLGGAALGWRSRRR
jgi:hypothetical protein